MGGLGPSDPEDGEVAARLARLADRLRPAEPGAAKELDDIAQVQRLALDHLVSTLRAWRGEILLDALGRDDLLVRLLGRRRLDPGAPPA
jgi:hypothetical protein